MDEQSPHRIREQMARVAAQLAGNAAFQAKSDKYLDRVERLLIREARRERELRRKKDSKEPDKREREKLERDKRWNDIMSQLAAAQLVTEEKLQRLIDERRGTNGKG